jgi:hypothetical protein
MAGHLPLVAMTIGLAERGTLARTRPWPNAKKRPSAAFLSIPYGTYFMR